MPTGAVGVVHNAHGGLHDGVSVTFRPMTFSIVVTRPNDLSRHCHSVIALSCMFDITIPT